MPNTPFHRLKIAKANLARFKTLLVKEEAKAKEARAKSEEAGYIRCDLLLQAMWLIERRMKSVARFKADVAELEEMIIRIR